MSGEGEYRPGDDSKAISRIADIHYGGFALMFEEHGWPERGQDMMRKVQSRVAETYGSVRHFERVHSQDDPFTGNPSVMLTSFWGFDPQSWGCVGFTASGRRDTVTQNTTNPFLMVCYVTEIASPTTPRHLWGKVVGFYEVTHIEGDKKEFIADWQYEREDPKKWRYSLKATRAWEFLPEYMPSIREFDPTLHKEKRERSVSGSAEFLNPDLVEDLKLLPRREVPVYRSAKAVEAEIEMPTQSRKQYVRGGAGRRSGYEVGEPKDTEKELYILQLSGDEEAYLGYAPEGRKIIKVGLSVSPQIRCDFFQKTMPIGAYEWSILKSTLRDDDPRYADFKTAEAGEMAMKQHLAYSETAEWLGGEFYLASSDDIDTAWEVGRDAARRYERDSER